MGDKWQFQDWNAVILHLSYSSFTIRPCLSLTLPVSVQCYLLTDGLFNSYLDTEHHLYKRLWKLLNDFPPTMCQCKCLQIMGTKAIKHLGIIRKKQYLWVYNITRKDVKGTKKQGWEHEGICMALINVEELRAIPNVQISLRISLNSEE